MDRRDARLHPFPEVDPPASRHRVRPAEAGNRGYSYPSGARVRALQAILRPPIPPNHPQNAEIAVREVFRALPGQGATQSARDSPTGGSSRPRPSRPSSRLAGPPRITPAGSSTTTGQRSVATTGFGGWSTPPPAASAARRKTGGQRGHGPPPASPGDTRSVATESMLASRP